MSSQSRSIYPLSPRNSPVAGFRGDSNAVNSSDSLSILESCTEPGHLAMQLTILRSASHITYNKDS